MAWLLGVGAGVVGMVMAAALKTADGWRTPMPRGIGILAALVSIFLLGALGIAGLDIVAYGDSAFPLRLRCMGLMVAGVMGPSA